MVHEKKTDTLLNVEIENEERKELFLILKNPDNNLEGDAKDNNPWKHPNDDKMKEKDIHRGNKDRCLENFMRNEQGNLRKPIASTYKSQMISVSNIIIFSMLLGTVSAKNLEPLESNELVKEVSKWVPDDLEDENYENKLISGYDCLDGSLPSTQISLNPPEQCNIDDGSAYEKPEKRRAQVLEHVKLIPVNITTCVVQFTVNVG